MITEPPPSEKMRIFLFFATCLLIQNSGFAQNSGLGKNSAKDGKFLVSLHFNSWEVVPEIACNMTEECIQCFDCALKAPTEPSDGLFVSIQAQGSPRYSWKFDSRSPDPFVAHGQFVNPIILVLEKFNSVELNSNQINSFQSNSNQFNSIQLVARVTHGFWANKCSYEAGEVIRLDPKISEFSIQLQSVCFSIEIKVNLIEKFRPNETKFQENSQNFDDEDQDENSLRNSFENSLKNPYYGWFLASVLIFLVLAFFSFCFCFLALIRKLKKKSKRRQKYEINHQDLEIHKSMIDSMTETDDQLPNLQPIFYPQSKMNGF